MVDNYDNLSINDFNVFLHELRTRELRKIPPGGKIFLSGGSAGEWYFDWINQNYSGITRHIGVEAYSPKPKNLPKEVEWIENTLGDMSGVGSNKVDLVFAGQTIEHLWAKELAGFLCESYRVLKKNGRIVLDSPNRLITYGLNWFQPQHTMELTVDEIVELLTIAGFTELEVKGIWLCYDKKNHCFLPLEPSSNTKDWTYKKRVELSTDNPEDCFTWWIEGKKSRNKPDQEKLMFRILRIYQEALPTRFSKYYHHIGKKVVDDEEILVNVNRGERGAILFGPYIPLKPGKYLVDFFLKRNEEKIRPDEIICTLDIYNHLEDKILVQKSLKYNELSSTRFKKISILIEISEMQFGICFRIWSTGKAGLSARYMTKLHNNKEITEM